MSKEKLVVIDPGHGGHDSGAVGPTGLKEKSVVLETGMLLVDGLNMVKGVKAISTRDRDSFVSLSRRCEIANGLNADLFVSLHCNSAETPAMGIETWINRKTKVSYPHAEAIQDEMVLEFDDTPDRGIKRRGFKVLRDTNMAAVLVEMEFIHVPCGETRLSDPMVIARYVAALQRGILNGLGIKDLGKIDDPEDEPVIHKPLRFRDAVAKATAHLNAALERYDQPNTRMDK